MFTRKKTSRKVAGRNMESAESPVCAVRRKQTYGPRIRPTRSKKGDKDLPDEMERLIDDYVDNAISTGVEGFKKEFASIASYRAPDEIYKYDSFLKHSDRNRYNDVVCIESTRVILTQDVPPSTDYIHANWIKFEKHDRVFIATQAPLDNTIDDFWRMIFQEKCPSIVNLTPMIENGKVKCTTYWPQHPGAFNTYDKMFVNTKKVEFEEQFTIYTIELLPEGCSDSHIVKMIHMTNWPDKGVPASGRHVLRLLRMVVANRLDCGPIVVHCSAGIGRTGSIILIDVILHKLFSGEKIELPRLFKQLRDQRASSINTESLYVFVVYSVLDYLRAKFPTKYKEKTQGFFDDFKAIRQLQT
ncbi:unnamed protein product [Cylicocyclus nassatus]|uniref:Protein-tyrosine phosphatase n=1 Tax=Cylicocyclus nassatus TaxID=53992 RepID=A0AA36HE14_CYLNA|nr:unnamed protein product [Cylicocyclus nassatus]